MMIEDVGPALPWRSSDETGVMAARPAGRRLGAQRCILVGSGSLSIQCAEALLARGHDIVVIASESAAIRDWAAQHGIAHVAGPAALLDHPVAKAGADYLFSIVNLSILPDAVLALAGKAAINFHDGPLPAYAGLNTPAWALMNGETTHGVTWHLMTGGIDRGAIVAERSFPIDADETALTLNAKCFVAGMDSFEEIAAALALGVSQRPQPIGPRAYYGRRARPLAAGAIRWAEPAPKIERTVRALQFGNQANPLGTAKCSLKGTAIIVHEARAESEVVHATPGTIVRVEPDGLVVATGAGVLRLLRLAATDGTPLPITEFVSHFDVFPGVRFDLLDDDGAERLAAADRITAAHQDFWVRRLASASPIDLPQVDRSRTGPASHDWIDADLPPRAASVVPERIVAAAIAYLARVTDREEVTVGFSSLVMSAQMEGLQPWFAPQVPLHGAVAFGRSMDALTEALSEEIRELHRHIGFTADLPARMPELRARGGDTMPVAILVVNRLDEARPAPRSEVTLAIEGSGRGCRWIYDSARIDEAAIRSMHDQFATLLDAALADPTLPVGQFPLLDATERQHILVDWNVTDAAWRSDACVHDLIAEQAARTPDIVALVCAGRSLNYSELDGRANQLARELIARGVGPDGMVGLFADRSLELVVAMLAIHKAGGAYVPLDPAYPADRIAYMVADSGVRLVLTQADLRDQVPAGTGDLLCLDADWDAISGHSDAPVSGRALPHHLAYVIYTSGSTGQPKGVMVEHRNAVNFFAGMDVKVTAPGVWLAVTSLSFDISVLELLWTLTRGCTVVIQTGDLTAAAAMPAAADRAIDFSLFYFASEDGSAGADKYRLLLEGAKFADRHGFKAVWTPERHFHAFGGLYPNPAVTGAAVAAVTERVEIRAGSVVLPLHHPARVAEEWSVVDNLSNGRVGISFAAGWQPDDFALRPENFADAKKTMLRDVETVRRLWRGEAVAFPGPLGKPVEVRTLPRPVRPELPFWLTAAGSVETFEAAGRMGGFLLTHLLGQTVAELADKIAAYRRAWRVAGHAGEGQVSLMLHSFVGPDAAAVRAVVHKPMVEYLRSSANLIKQHAWSFPAFRRRPGMAEAGDIDLQALHPDEFDALLEHAFDRYYETSGLFGTPEQCLAMVDRVRAIGVDEVCCLIDFGVEPQQVLDHLPWLDRLRALASAVPDQAGDESLAGLMRRHRVTHLQCTPSTARMMLTAGTMTEALGRLQQLLIGGEALPPSLAAELETVAGGEILNMYGPTETTVWSATERVTAGDAAITIGRPLANQQIYILDRRGEPVPGGVPGEIVIGGLGVVRGYLNRPDLTAERFVGHPLRPGERAYRTGDLGRLRDDGKIEFLGRLDHQVKIRGHRIELGEIEAALIGHPVVEQAVVVAREDTAGDVRLCAYFIAAGGVAPPAGVLRDHLRSRLPEFMLPAHFSALSALPRTPNGKIDRKALPAPDQAETIAGGSEADAGAAFVAPAAGSEERIAAVWRDVLKLPAVGIHDNFFDLGGHSLLAIQAHRKLCATVSERVSITDLFRFPTIAALSAHLDRRDEGERDGEQARHRAIGRLAALERRRRVPARAAMSEGG